MSRLLATSSANYSHLADTSTPSEDAAAEVAEEKARSPYLDLTHAMAEPAVPTPTQPAATTYHSHSTYTTTATSTRPLTTSDDVDDSEYERIEPDDATLDEDKRCCSRFCHYETQQIVRIKNKKTAFIHRAFTVLIMTYIIVYGLILKKGYQVTENASGESTIKLQGLSWVNSSLPWLGPTSPRVFEISDAYDLRVPPVEVNAFFLTTNRWVTRNQTRGKCISYDVKTPNTCDSTHPCEKLSMTPVGRRVGGKESCWVNYTDPQQNWPTPDGGFCLLYSWCPSEYEPPAQERAKYAKETAGYEVQGVKDFTVYIRMSIHYPQFHKHLDNIGGDSRSEEDNIGDDELTRGLNEWTVEEMVRMSGYEWKDVNETGALIALNSVWNCDFDSTAHDRCVPSINFIRLDDPSSPLSRGFNFRTVDFTHDKLGSRDLTKRYGVRVIVLMHGVGSQYDVVAMLTAIGAGISLLSIATLSSDIIATRLLAERVKYREVKYREISITDPETHILDNVTRGLTTVKQGFTRLTSVVAGEGSVGFQRRTSTSSVTSSIQHDSKENTEQEVHTSHENSSEDLPPTLANVPPETRDSWRE